MLLFFSCDDGSHHEWWRLGFFVFRSLSSGSQKLRDTLIAKIIEVVGLGSMHNPW